MKSNRETNALADKVVPKETAPNAKSIAAGLLRGVGRYVLLCGAVLVVALTQPALADRYGTIREVDDGYALPSPDQTLVMSLGYRAAIADLIYAHVLVAYGLHFETKRRFEHVGRYLDTVNRLDPYFVQPYLFADTLLTLQPEAPREEDYRKAREVLLRGTQALPFNQEVWFTAGQYVAFIAPPHLRGREEKRRWKLEGAGLLGRACELASSNSNIPHHCLSAATLLNRAGEREALIQMLRRTLAVNDDEAVQQRALAALEKWGGERNRIRAEERSRVFATAWSEDLRFVTRERLLLLGPRFDALSCVGTAAAPCVDSWLTWSERHSAASR